MRRGAPYCQELLWVLFTLSLVGRVRLDALAKEETCVADDLKEKPPQSSDDRSAKEESLETECTLYLAPSTIPNAGLGIFTTKQLAKGELIGHGDVMIPLIDLDEQVACPFWDYVWEGEDFGMDIESAKFDVTVFSPGLDAAVNCNMALINVESVEGEYDLAGLHRSKNPGAGANTPYFSKKTKTKMRIPAGGELFKNYGNEWFETRDYIFGQIPVHEDYRHSQLLIQNFTGLTKDLSASAITALWDILHTMPWDSRTLNAIPKNYQDARVIAKDGMLAFHQPSGTRTVSSIRKTGKCMNNIKSGRSTLVEAGRGAFSTRYLKKGTIITGSPLIHIPNRTKFIPMFDGETERNSTRPSGEQLLINYCFGANSSSLLLCPYTSGVNYINHHRERANVQIQWAQDGVTSHNSSWFNVNVSDMDCGQKPQLAIDYVATRDIKADEELFMDYGIEWERAWIQHVDSWRGGSESYHDANAWTQMLRSGDIRTASEQESNPYPDHISMKCHSYLERRPHAYRKIEDFFPAEWGLDETGLPCNILDRTVDEEYNRTTYTVEVLVNEGENSTIRTMVPPEAFAFVNMPYTTDIHLSGAFRHSIMIPDSMFPSKWRNLETDEDNQTF